MGSRPEADGDMTLEQLAAAVDAAALNWCGYGTDIACPAPAPAGDGTCVTGVNEGSCCTQPNSAGGRCGWALLRKKNMPAPVGFFAPAKGRFL